jgi:hypothetical protein
MVGQGDPKLDKDIKFLESLGTWMEALFAQPLCQVVAALERQLISILSAYFFQINSLLMIYCCSCVCSCADFLDLHKFICSMNSCIIQSHLPTHLVFEFEVTPIPFLMELFIDSTGEVVMVSKDMGTFLRISNARYCSLSVMVH